MSEPDYRYLPPLLSEVRDRVGIEGIEGVKRLIAEFGGQEIYVPKHPKEGQPLVERCGMAVAKAMADMRGGENVAVPNGAWCGSKKAAILAADGMDLSRNRMAKETGASARYIRMIARKRNNGKAGSAGSYG